MLFFLLMGVSYIVYGIYGEKYIMWDGSNYFGNVLQYGSFSCFPRGRMTTDVLMQMFAVAAWRLGCTDPALIGAMQGLGCTFWTVFFYFLAMIICFRHEREDYAGLIVVFSCMSITFKGLFLQMESTMGVSLYMLLYVIILLWKQSKESYFQKILLAVTMLLSFHMNEYFFIWDIVLCGIILYRVLKGRMLGKRWLAICGVLTINIFLCFTDILWNGVEGATMDPLGQLRLIFLNRAYVVSCIAVLVVLALCGWRGFPRLKAVLVVFLCLALTIYQIYWYRKEAMTIGMWAFPTRLTCLGWSLLTTIVLSVLHFSTGEMKRMFDRGVLILCMSLCLTTAFFNRRTGHEYHNYNTRRVVMCVVNPDSGFLHIRETEIGNYSFNVDGTMRAECFELLVLRGIKEINTVLTDRDMGNEVDVDYSRYGISIKEECFSE